MVHIKRKQFGSTFCGLAGGQFYDWTSMENLKNYDEDKLCPDCFLRLSDVSGSADIIKFGAYLTGHDEETIKQMLNDYQRHFR